MPRKKPKEVDIFRMDQYAIDFPIMLDTENADFYANYGGETHRHSTLNGLRNILRKFIQDSLEITWHPVILVTNLADRNGRSWQQVGFWSERMYVAFVNGVRKKTDWSGMYDVPYSEDERRQCMQSFYHHGLQFESLPLNGPLVSKHKEDYLLPYTEDTWNALQNLQDKIGELRKRLDALLSTSEGLLQLSQMKGILALPKQLYSGVEIAIGMTVTAIL